MAADYSQPREKAASDANNDDNIKDSVLQKIHAANVSLCEALSARFIGPPTTKSGPDLSSNALSRRAVFAVGISGYGLWHLDDPVHLVCVSDNTPALFWDFVAESLQVERSRLGSVEKATLLLSSLDGPRDGVAERFRYLHQKYAVNVYLHYCRTSSGFDMSQFMAYVEAPTTPTSSHELEQWDKLVNLAHVRKMSDSNGPGDKFRFWYERLRRWAQRQGICAPEFDVYLSSERIFWFLFHFDRDIGLADPATDLESGDTSLLDHIRSHNCDFASIRSASGLPLPGRTLESVEARVIEGRANSVTSLAPNDGTLSFLTQFHSYAQIRWESWLASSVLRRDLLRDTMTLCMRELAGVSCPWPRPLYEDEMASIFAVGFEDDDEEAMQAIRDIEGLAPDGAVIMTSLCSREEIRALYDSWSTSRQSSAETASQSDISIVSAPSSGNTISIDHHTSHAKLPTAKQMLSRLRHDPAHAAIAYEVGYLDRFAGMLWMSIEEWGDKPVEDETFIPLTRVRMFRRRDDGAVVWERGRREG